MKLKFNWSAIKADFDMNSVTEVYFWKSEWEKFDPHDHNSPVSIYYYIYRFLYMAFFLGTLIQNFVCITPNGFYLLYLTNLTFLLQFIYSVLFFLYVSYKIIWRKKSPTTSPSTVSNNNTLGHIACGPEFSYHNEDYQLPWICKIIWILHNVLCNVPYVVTAIYWTVLFKDHKEDERICETLVNVFTHGMNSPMALLEVFVIAVPIRKSHVIFPIISGIGYSLYSLLYDIFNGDYPNDRGYIYPMLDWGSKPGLAIGTCIGVTFGCCVALHFITCWGIYRLRIYLKSKCMSKSQVFIVDRPVGYGGTDDFKFGRDFENKNYH